MAKRPFPLVQTKCLLIGTETYEKKKAEVIQELNDSIPEDLWISQDIIDSPPLDVRDIPRTCGILTEEELEITENYDTTSLALALAKKKYTAVTVARAFAKRAAIAHQVTACLIQFFMDEALERAQYLDDYQEKTGKTIGPLHGVPVSIKEHMPVKGHYSSWGFISSRETSEKDSLKIEILRNAGAVFYVKRYQTQGIMHLESNSHYGRTLNPANINLSSGGSTGGEAALIAMEGSVLGLGTDIGGSVRGPCGFSGIHGFKPTCYTLTMKDFLPAGFAAELKILCSTGPICRSLRDMELFMHILTSANMHLRDPRVIPIPMDRPANTSTRWQTAKDRPNDERRRHHTSTTSPPRPRMGQISHHIPRILVQILHQTLHPLQRRRSSPANPTNVIPRRSPTLQRTPRSRWRTHVPPNPSLNLLRRVRQRAHCFGGASAEAEARRLPHQVRRKLERPGYRLRSLPRVLRASGGT